MRTTSTRTMSTLTTSQRPYLALRLRTRCPAHLQLPPLLRIGRHTWKPAPSAARCWTHLSLCALATSLGRRIRALDATFQLLYARSCARADDRCSRSSTLTTSATRHGRCATGASASGRCSGASCDLLIWCASSVLKHSGRFRRGELSGLHSNPASLSLSLMTEWQSSTATVARCREQLRGPCRPGTTGHCR